MNPYTGGICNPDDPLSCVSLSESPRNQLVEIIELSGGQSCQRISDKYEVALFIYGAMILSVDDLPNENIYRERIILLPPGKSVNMYCLEAAYMIICRITEDVKFCYNTETSKNRIITDQIEKLPSLPLRHPIDMFVKGLSMCIGRGMLCETFLVSKFTELMFLIKTFYAETEISSFFQPLVGKYTHFQSRVMVVIDNVRTVKEMAQLCHMTEIGFRKRFKQEMGVSPGDYLLERKKRLISRDLSCGIKTNNEICEEYGFTSQSSFHNFCRMHLGGKPSDLRIRRRNE